MHIPKKKFGNDKLLNMDCILSSNVLFLLYATPFYKGVPGEVSCENISLSARYDLNSLSKYSPPQFDRSALIGFLNCFSIFGQTIEYFQKSQAYDALDMHIRI